MNCILKSLMLLIPLIVFVACETSEAELCHGDNCALVRFKAITVLEVDGELREFYSVLQAKVLRLEEGQSAQGFGGRSKVWKEATVIDLGERGRAYVLHSSYIPKKTVTLSAIYPQALLDSFGSKANMGNLKKNDLKLLKQASGRYPYMLRGNLRPTFAYFTDEADQNSIEYLHQDNLTKVFGEGVSFVGFFIEKTDEGITDGKILDYLPWLNLEPYKMFEQAPKGIPRNEWKLGWLVTKNTFVIPEHLRKSR